MPHIKCGLADGPLMFLYGWPELNLIWRAQIYAFAGDGWRCITPDLRGYGGSFAPLANNTHTNEQVVANMMELQDHLDGKPPIWVGQDWGCVLTDATAAHDPKRSRGIVLISVLHFSDANALPTLVPLVDRRVYPADQFSDGTTTAITRHISGRPSPTLLQTRQHRWRQFPNHVVPPPSARLRRMH